MWSSLDSMFGPQLAGHFDFTLLFEQIMLTIVPGGVIALAIPYYLRNVVRSTRQVGSGLLLWLKLAVGLTLIATQTTNVILWHNADLFQTGMALSATIMSLLSSVCILIILYIAHAYSLQPSAFLSVFLSITMLFDATVARSYFLREGFRAIGALQVSVVVLKLVMVLLEEVPKRAMFLSERQRRDTAQETASGFWNRYLFLWLNSLMLRGFCGDLTLDDLPHIDEQFDSSRVFEQFLPAWTQGKSHLAAVAWKAQTNNVSQPTSHPAASLRRPYYIPYCGSYCLP